MAAVMAQDNYSYVAHFCELFAIAMTGRDIYDLLEARMSQAHIMRFSSLLSVALLLAACGAAPAGADDLAAVSQQQPVLYGTAWCPYCKAARTWFEANKVAYTNCDVEADARCGQAYAVLKRKYAASGVPTFVYKGKIWGGYDEEQMAEIAAHKN